MKTLLHRRVAYLSLLLLPVTLDCQHSPSPAPSPITATPSRSVPLTAHEETQFRETVQPFIGEHCMDCHNDDRLRGDLDLTPVVDSAPVFSNDQIWKKVEKMLRLGKMPPKKRPRPPTNETDQVTEWIRQRLALAADAVPSDPGRVTVRRLNRAEYKNTIRDLLGVDYAKTDAFPPDDSGYGFDNIGDVLSLSPLLLEKYLDAAEEISAEVNARESSGDSSGERYVYICEHGAASHEADCTRKIIAHVARRAYRGPVTNREVRKIAALAKSTRGEDGPFEEGIAVALQAILISPRFLYRIEQDRRPNDPESVHRVNDFELASRLSYFLWSSMPDDALLELAKRKRLRKPKVLEAQVARMLKNERSMALVENFSGQWLELRNLARVRPDRRKFPQFNQKLQQSMVRETELFVAAIIDEDRSILDFLNADFTYVNEPLAKLYGISGIEGDEFQRVSLEGTNRGGILSHASILTVTSYPLRTSPVLRGIWILDNILGDRPGDPPANVPALKDDEVGTAVTLRAQLEKHREDPSCASCHDQIDPLGFGLENFDPIGAWRTHDGDLLIDSAGILPDGRAFSGPKDLRSLLVERKDDFAYSLTEKMLTYALGRGLEDYDRPSLKRIHDELSQNDYRIGSLVRAIVNSRPFQMRRGEGGAG